jgi:glycosyltransferase involved in cell wall biosynthesis
MGIGNAYGYSTHARNMKKHVANIADICPDAEISLQIQTADKFQPIEGKKMFLFTMYEADDIPASFASRLHLADHIIVPCEHNKWVFRKYTDRPISVCHEGCNTDVYYFKDRQAPKITPFRFLWVGAPNPRKGWEEVVVAWNYMVGKENPNIELYLKTTMGEIFEKRLNVTYDSRNLSLKELVELYHSAHCFLFPTRGEGWGLTLTEAMSTGVPCIATQYSGTADFFDSYVGYPIDYELRRFYHAQYELHTRSAAPSVEHLVDQMAYVYNNYTEARAKGRKAAQRIRNKFTWEKSAKRLVEILRKNS